MRKTLWISAALVALSLSACKGGKLSKDQCEKIVDHGIELVAGKVSPEMLKAAKEAQKSQLDDAIKQCMDDGTQADYDCAMKATSIAEMSACDKN